MGDYTPQSRSEEILYDTIHSLEYTERPQSRIEELLLELKAVIEAGSGTTDYEDLENKPSINNVELSGDKSLADLGAASEGAVAAKASQSDIAPTFSDATAYTDGDVVYHEGSLYRFTANHSAGAWDSAAVESVTVDDLVDGLKPVDRITDGDMRPVTSNTVYDAMNDSVTITKMTDETYAQFIRRLYNLIDFNKLSARAKLHADTNVYTLSRFDTSTNLLMFTTSYLNYSSQTTYIIRTLAVSASSAYVVKGSENTSTGAWSTELDTDVPNKMTLYYR